MKALITGASSGIGYDIAKYLSCKGYDLIVVARREDKLKKLQKEVNKKIKIITLDLSQRENCFKLYNIVKKCNIDILVNNAGFGDFGEFFETDINKELEMINLNICTVHILTKLFLKDMVEKDRGYILNVASSAAFAPGPLMATYYSTKSYVYRLSESIISELKHKKSNVKVSVLCPGPVKTEFNDVANVNFSFNALDSEYVARYAVDKMLKGKNIIVPGAFMKIARISSKIIPDCLLSKIIYLNQTKKVKDSVK